MIVKSKLGSKLKAKPKSMKREKLPSHTKVTLWNSSENLLTKLENSIWPPMLDYLRSFAPRQNSWAFIQKTYSGGSTPSKLRKKKEVGRHFTLKWKRDLPNLLSAIQKWKGNIFWDRQNKSWMIFRSLEESTLTSVKDGMKGSDKDW